MNHQPKDTSTAGAYGAPVLLAIGFGAATALLAATGVVIYLVAR